jgi:tRNA 5-methylaminomethyl-2-thiouridine biosynthesis bifunctional protein
MAATAPARVTPARIDWTGGPPQDLDAMRPLWRGADPWHEAAQCFVESGGLSQDWASRDRYVLLEAGFGAGIGFASAWRRWRDDPDRPHRFFHVAIEPRPLSVRDLRRSIGAVGLDPALAGPLLTSWPLPMRGVHRIEFDGGRCVLLLALGDPVSLMPQLDLRADAAWLTDRTLHTLPESGRLAFIRAACARLVAEGAVATDSVDPAVHRAIGTTGVVGGRVSRNSLDGSSGDSSADESRETIASGWAGRRRHGGNATGPTQMNEAGVLGDIVGTTGTPRTRDAFIVGAGLAGCAVAHGLARRGWSVTVLDGAAGIAQGSSGQPALAQHPSVTPDDAPLSRLSRAALFLSRTVYDVGVLQRSGRLQLMETDVAQALAAGCPPAFATALDATQATDVSGLPMRRGGLWLPLSGWADPVALCNAWLAGATRRIGRRVARLQAADGGWLAMEEDGTPLAHAPVAIVAAGEATHQLLSPPTAGWPPVLQRRAGRTATLPALRGFAAPRCVVGGDGHLVPLPDGRLSLGPLDDGRADDDDNDDQDGKPDADLAARIRDWLEPGSGHPLATLDASRWQASPPQWRIATADHLPIAGPVPDALACAAMQEALRRDDRLPIPTLPGLWTSTAFGGRGLLWAVIAAEAIASHLEGEPGPIERDLLQAIDPRRFARHHARRRL